MKKIALLFVLLHFFNNYSMDSDFNPYEFCDQMDYEQFPSEAETTAPEMGLLMPSQVLDHSQTESQIPEIGEIDEWIDQHDASLGDNSNDQNSQSDSEVLVDVDGSSQYGVQVSELQEPEYLNEADSTLKIPSKRLPEPSAVKECEQLEPKTKRAKRAVVLAAAAQIHKQLSESSESEPEADDSKDADFRGNSSGDCHDDDYNSSDSNEGVEASDSENENSQETDEEFEPRLKRARTVLTKAATAKTRKRGNSKAKHQCPHCSYKTDSLSHSERHIRGHIGEKPFKCPYEGCDKKYTQQWSVNTHIKAIHLQEKIECNECGRPFAYLSELTLHRRSEHTFESLYECHDCRKTFFKSSNLRRHERTVHHKGC